MKKLLSVMLFTTLLLTTGLFAEKKQVVKETSFLQEGKLGLIFFYAGPSAENYYTNTDSSFLNAYRTLGLGFTWNVTEHFIIEPALIFNKTKEYEEDRQSSANNRTVDRLTLGAELGLFYSDSFHKSFYYYTGLRTKVLNISRDSKYDATASKSEESEFYIGESIVFGLKYFFNENFALFADIDLGFYFYERNYKNWNASGTLTSDNKNKSYATDLGRSQLGIAFYF